MELEQLGEKLRERLGDDLPGNSAHIKLLPQHRLISDSDSIRDDAVPSAVLIMLYLKENEIYFAAIKRSEYDGVHSGQISLPGGRLESFDMDHAAAAFRETREEIGIEAENLELLGVLSKLYISRSNFIVHPFVAIHHGKPMFVPDPVEVKEIIEIPLKLLLEERNITNKTLKFKDGFTLVAPGFQVNEHFIWGATAMILMEFSELLQSLE